MHNQDPKMSRKEAVMLWNSLTPQQRFQFNEMLQRMKNGELFIKEVNVDTQEHVKSIVLEPKDKPSKPIEPFMKHFSGKRKIDAVVEAVKKEGSIQF